MTVVVLATGPSLNARDAAAVAAARARRPDLRVVAVNDAYRIAPDADLLYAADAKWWTAHDGVPGFAGEKWTQDRNDEAGEVAARYGLNAVHSVEGEVPSFDPARITTGSNSGFQAVNLSALMTGPDGTIVLLGFDMATDGRQTHFFGDHPKGLQVASPYRMFARKFERAAPLYAAKGITVLNASRRSALKCFRQCALEVVL